MATPSQCALVFDAGDAFDDFVMEDGCWSANATVFDACCRIKNISWRQPEWFAVPLYGYVAPFIVALTIVTNTFVVLVLSHKNLRTPTNYVLLAMAVAELMTGLSSSPWLIYYYTLQGYITDHKQGLSEFWCRYSDYFATHFPTIFHTAAIWLTVYLAIQRYIYVCVPSSVPRYCTLAKTRCFIATICVTALVSESPNFLAVSSFSMVPNHTMLAAKGLPHDYRVCVRRYSPSVESFIGTDLFFSTLLWYRVICVHFLPCALLLVFTWKLVKTIRKADKKRFTNMVSSQPSSTKSVLKRRWRGGVKEKSCGFWKIIVKFDDVDSTTAILKTAPVVRRPSRPAHRFQMAKAIEISELEELLQMLTHQRSMVLHSRLMHATTRMLIVVISIFLMIEIPVALIFILHIVTVMYELLPRWIYHPISILIILRNVMIIFTYPLNFAIYCGMSEQFRQQFRQLFSRHLLYVPAPVTQLTNGGIPRFSIQLIDINKLRHHRSLTTDRTDLRSGCGSTRISPNRLSRCLIDDRCISTFVAPQPRETLAEINAQAATWNLELARNINNNNCADL